MKGHEFTIQQYCAGVRCEYNPPGAAPVQSSHGARELNSNSVSLAGVDIDVAIFERSTPDAAADGRDLMPRLQSTTERYAKIVLSGIHFAPHHRKAETGIRPFA